MNPPSAPVLADEKIHAIECILSERMEAAAAMIEAAEVEQLARLDVMLGEESAPAEALAIETAKPAADMCRVRWMHAFYSASKAAGLDVKDAEGMTWALAKYLRCLISSRAVLSSGQWAEATAGIEYGLVK